MSRRPDNDKPDNHDGEMTAELLACGLTHTQLSRLFRTSLTKVQRKMAGIQPLTYRGKIPVYDIVDAAGVLAAPTADVEEMLKNLKPSDMPMSLQKDFWSAQKMRQEFEERAGQLWRTEKVQTVMSDILKLFRQRVMLFCDTVDQQTGLTDEQREVINNMSDGLLEDVRSGVVELFGDGYDPTGERDETFENGGPIKTDKYQDDPDYEL